MGHGSRTALLTLKIPDIPQKGVRSDYKALQGVSEVLL